MARKGAKSKQLNHLKQDQYGSGEVRSWRLIKLRCANVSLTTLLKISWSKRQKLLCHLWHCFIYTLCLSLFFLKETGFDISNNKKRRTTADITHFISSPKVSSIAPLNDEQESPVLLSVLTSTFIGNHNVQLKQIYYFNEIFIFFCSLQLSIRIVDIVDYFPSDKGDQGLCIHNLNQNLAA